MTVPPRWKDFSHINCWIFDLDNTLYPHESNLFAKIDKRMGEFLSDFLKVELCEAKAVQKKYFHEYGTTLSGLMQNHDIDPYDFLQFVHDIDVSDLPADAALGFALSQLEGRKIIFTNGSLFHAKNVSSQLGIEHHFDHIFDIVAADFRPKPDRSVYEKLVEEFDIDPARAVLFEDMAVNLAPAHELGMTTVWIPNPAHWSREGAEGPHIHYITDNLANWLKALLEDKIRTGL